MMGVWGKVWECGWVWKWEVGEDFAGAADYHTYVPGLGLGLGMQRRVTQIVIRRCCCISRTELPYMSLRGRTQSS